MRTNEEADWATRVLVSELERDYQREAELERLCHQSEMLRHVEQTIGIFFAREDDLN